MKNVLVILTFALSLSTAFARDVFEISFSATLSPFAVVTRALEEVSVVTIWTFATKIGKKAQERGVAFKEQLRDDLVSLDADMASGEVKSIDEVRQPALKEFLKEISKDESQMESINSEISEGTELQKIAVAVTVSLLS